MKLNIRALARGARFVFLDELRGISIITVVIYHVLGILGVPHILLLSSGVDLFLIISGFLLGFSGPIGSVVRFLIDKFKRIFPAYWASLVMFIIFSIPFTDIPGVMDIVLHSIGIHAFGPGQYFGDLNQAYWFISIILFAYILYIPLRRRLDNTSFVIFICGLTTLVLNTIYMNINNEGMIHTLIPRILSIFLGMIAGRMFANGWINIKINLYLLFGVVGIVLSSQIASGFLRAIIAISIIGLWYAIREHSIRYALGRSLSNTLCRVGKYSYEIFLFHAPFVQSYSQLFARKFSFPNEPKVATLVLFIFVGLSISITISILVHNWLANRSRVATNLK